MKVEAINGVLSAVEGLRFYRDFGAPGGTGKLVKAREVYRAAGSPRVPDVPRAEALEYAARILCGDDVIGQTADRREVAAFLRAFCGGR